MEYSNLSKIKDPLVIVEGVAGAAYDEIVEVKSTADPPSSPRLGRVVRVDGDVAAVLVFEGVRGLTLGGTSVRFTGKPLEMGLSPEILGRVFDGLARPMDNLGKVFASERREINGTPINPALREYPKNYIQTGFSAIDGLTTLIRGQKLPLFSVVGLPHDRLAVQIATQAELAGSGKFATVFAAMGVSYDTAEFFRRSLVESGQSERTVMFLNLDSNPPTERIATPRFALTAAEYLAFDLGYHVLAILTDMTAYAEALREISAARGEVPGRKGYPGYMYSDMAGLYERAGIIKEKEGSLTLLPILTMPGEDITHPIPDITGFITEGQIVLSRALHQRGIYPPIDVLPSLSRLMKDGVEWGSTAAKIFAAYAEARELRTLLAVIGEDDLTDEEKQLLDFGTRFEQQFLHQHENRSIAETLEIASAILPIAPQI